MLNNSISQDSPSSKLETQIIQMLTLLLNESPEQITTLNFSEYNDNNNNSNNNSSEQIPPIYFSIPFSSSIWSQKPVATAPSYSIYNSFSFQLYLLNHKCLTFPLLTQLHKNFLPLIQDFHLAHVLQSTLKNTSKEIIHHLYLNEIRNNNLISLLYEQSPSYFIKNLYTYLPIYDRVDLLLILNPNIKQLSCNLNSTYAIQFIIENMKSETEKQLILNSIKYCYKDLFTNTYGAHVLVKLITNCSYDTYICDIISYAISKLQYLAYNSNAIVVIRKIYQDIYNETVSDFYFQLKQFVVDNVKELFEHVCGNYIIQTIICFWNVKDVENVLKGIDGYYGELSNKKYSSNVVEKCIEKSEILLKRYINEVSKNGIDEVIKNIYGNYVIQKALKISKGEDKVKLIESAKRNVGKIGDKKLILKWKGILERHEKLMKIEQGY